MEYEALLGMDSRRRSARREATEERRRRCQAGIQGSSLAAIQHDHSITTCHEDPNIRRRATGAAPVHIRIDPQPNPKSEMLQRQEQSDWLERADGWIGWDRLDRLVYVSFSVTVGLGITQAHV